MKNILLVIFLLSTVACSSQVAKVEKEDSRELSGYSILYTQLIRKNIDSELGKQYRGKMCKVNIKLVVLRNGNAKVKEVKTLKGNAEVCATTIAAVKRVKAFPLPENRAVREELLDINLTFAPSHRF